MIQKLFCLLQAPRSNSVIFTERALWILFSLQASGASGAMEALRRCVHRQGRLACRSLQTVHGSRQENSLGSFRQPHRYSSPSVFWLLPWQFWITASCELWQAVGLLRAMPIEKSPARNGDLPVLLDGEEIRFSEPKTRPGNHAHKSK